MFPLKLFTEIVMFSLVGLGWTMHWFRKIECIETLLTAELQLLLQNSDQHANRTKFKGRVSLF